MFHRRATGTSTETQIQVCLTYVTETNRRATGTSTETQIQVCLTYVTETRDASLM
jgi:hypothetical protein